MGLEKPPQSNLTSDMEKPHSPQQANLVSENPSTGLGQVSNKVTNIFSCPDNSMIFTCKPYLTKVSPVGPTAVEVYWPSLPEPCPKLLSFWLKIFCLLWYEIYICEMRSHEWNYLKWFPCDLTWHLHDLYLFYLTKVSPVGQPTAVEVYWPALPKTVFFLSEKNSTLIWNICELRTHKWYDIKGFFQTKFFRGDNVNAKSHFHSLL